MEDVSSYQPRVIFSAMLGISGVVYSYEITASRGALNLAELLSR